MTTAPPDPVEESHWTTDWSARGLTAEERDHFEDIVADLYDWLALSIDSCFAAVKQHCVSLPSGIQGERHRDYYAAIIEYTLVELVMCCEADEKYTISGKLNKLVDFIICLVDEIQVIDVKLIDKVFHDVCEDGDAYPHLTADEAPETSGILMFKNFHEFAIRLYRGKYLRSMLPAKKVIEATFGLEPIRNVESFFAATQWLTYAQKDVYDSNPDCNTHWSAWYKELCERTAEYGKVKDTEARRLSISGRTAQKGMETMDANLLAFDQAIRQGIEESERIHVEESAAVAEKAMLVDRRIRVLEASLSVPDPKEGVVL
ncbi:hypothetical protein BJ170DRAFT_645821 [Xylariales sp. AK1849]|nr:hypothetical protein BJ170DRAFT_645821 [Xylariales sp. AK1849]